MHSKLSVLILSEIVLIILLLIAMTHFSGVLVFVLLEILFVLMLVLIKQIAETLNFTRVRIAETILLGSSIIVVFIVFELVLGFTQISGDNFAQNTELDEAITIPEIWKRRDVQVNGAKYAFYWHDKLHVFDANEFRRTEPFPDKQYGKFRIIALGDSLTYGEGVDEQDAYPRLIEKELGKSFPVEVLNLGVRGNQSEDTVNVLKAFLPALKPDLVLYGVCLNDFLPSRLGEYENNMAYSVPLPRKIKAFFIKHTLVGEFLDTRYNNFLINMGVRNDFYTDILKDFDSYQARFAKDVTAMNRLVEESGLPPVLTMVLTAYPSLNSKNHQITLIAEKLLISAGMQVIPTQAYVDKYQGQSFAVSRWEGHPNEKAHKIFAEMFTDYLKQTDLVVSTEKKQ